MESIFKVKKSKNLNPPFPWNSPSTPPSPVPVNYTVELETQDRYRGVQVNSVDRQQIHSPRLIQHTYTTLTSTWSIKRKRWKVRLLEKMWKGKEREGCERKTRNGTKCSSSREIILNHSWSMNIQLAPLHTFQRLFKNVNLRSVAWITKI